MLSAKREWQTRRGDKRFLNEAQTDCQNNILKTNLRCRLVILALINTLR